MSLTDLNKISETILVPLLSEIYDLPKLRNLNTESANFPGIDLADDEKRVAIQVTATATSEKIKHSLSEYVTNELYQQYDRLIMYILVEKQKTYSGTGFDDIVKCRFNFDLKRDIQDYRDLLEVIGGFQIDRAKRVLEILEANIQGEIPQSELLQPLPDPDELPEAQEDLPPGSRLTFPRNYAFTGRVPDLKAIAETLFYHAPGASRRMALTGGGGSGKTQIAVEFCYRYGRFTYGVHWLDATQSIESQIALCGEAMKLPGWENLKQPEQVQRTLEAWRAQPERLVVLDYLGEPPQLGNWLELLKVHPLLVTSRRDDYEAETGVNVHPVQILPRQEGRELLRRLAKELDNVSDAVLDTLCDRLGDLPLALDLTGRYLAKEGIDIPDYLEELKEVESLLEHESFISEELNKTTAHVRSLAATFRSSWKALETEDELDLLVRRSFLACGYCAANILIPTDLLLAALELDGKTGERKLKRGLNRLFRLGLLAESERGVVMHPLLAEFARLQDRQAQESALPGLAKALGTLSDKANESGLPERFKPLRAHMEATARWAEEVGLEGAGRLWNNLGYHLRIVAEYEGARAAFERSLAIDERAYGPDHPDVARDVNNLGLVLQDLGDLAEARAACERALAIWEKALEPDHPNVATCVNNLGSVLQELGDLAGARAAYERALAIDEQAFGGNHPKVATDVNNLGLVLQDLGDLAGARAAYERALAIWENALGPDHPNVATCVNNLGLVRQELGDLAEARAAFERSLAIDEQALGPGHPDVARDVNNLGGVLRDLGDLAGARAAFERALAIWEKALGPDHPHAATGVNNLGWVLKVQGDLVGAQAAYERALAIDEQALGPDHPDVARDINNLGGVLRDLGDLAGARAAYERALAILEKALGPDHPRVATSVNNLGLVLKDLGDLAGARAAYERALAIDERIFGPDHPDVARDINNLGGLLFTLGDLVGARAAFERALAIDERALGPNHSTVATDVTNLGRVLQDLGDLAGARAAYERALAIDERVFGPDHLDVAREANNLGMVLFTLGDLEGARAAFERALAILEKILPADHPNIQAVRENLRSLERPAVMNDPSEPAEQQAAKE